MTVSQESRPHKSVIVVGGGLAGIAASLALAREGVQVRLLEARRRLGGRTGSFAKPGSEREEAVDYCQHVGMGCCTNLKRLIRWLDQEDCWTEYSELHFYGAQGRYRKLAALPWLPAPLHLLGWLLAWPDLRLRDRWAIARGMWALRGITIDESHENSGAQDWLETHRQPPRSIANFWSTIVVSALGEELARVNLAAMCKVLQEGFLNHRDAFHLLVPKLPLDTLFNANATQRLRQLQVDVQFASPVSQILPSTQNTGALTQSTEAATQSTGAATYGVQVRCGLKSYTADAVVLAVPWHQLSKLNLMEVDPQAAAIFQRTQQLESSPITGIHTWWDKPWLEHPHATVVGRMCQWIFAQPTPPAAGTLASQTMATSHLVEAPINVARAIEHYYQIVISASRDMPIGSQQEIENRVLADLAAVFPRSRGAQLLRMKVVRDPQAVFSVAPESIKYRAPTNGLRPPIVLAGDWTRTGWPATMEGAILSGFRAAESVCERWGMAHTFVASPLGKIGATED